MFDRPYLDNPTNRLPKPSVPALLNHVRRMEGDSWHSVEGPGAPHEDFFGRYFYPRLGQVRERLGSKLRHEDSDVELLILTELRDDVIKFTQDRVRVVILRSVLIHLRDEGHYELDEEFPMRILGVGPMGRPNTQKLISAVMDARWFTSDVLSTVATGVIHAARDLFDDFKWGNSSVSNLSPDKLAEWLLSGSARRRW